MITDRMLKMFKKRPASRRRSPRSRSDAVTASFLQDPDFIQVLYIVAFICFILGLRLLTHPSTARSGNAVAAVGMAIAVVATLLIEDFVDDYGLIALGIGDRRRPWACPRRAA